MVESMAFQIIAAVLVGLISMILIKYYYGIKKTKKTTGNIDKELTLIADAFKNGKPLTRLPTIQFVGRIQYEPYNGYLTKTVRSFAFVSGPDGIFSMSQHKGDKDKCLFVGFSMDWLQSQCNKKRKFRLLLFPKQFDKYEAIWCRWDNIFNLFKEKYNDNVYVRIKPFIHDLKTKSFEEITKNANFNFSDVEENGESDPNYMSFDKFISIPIDSVTMIDVRLFLYCWLHFNELFDGDGYTQDQNGNKGCKEYIIPNIKLDTIPNLHIVPLNVDEKINNEQSS